MTKTNIIFLFLLQIGVLNAQIKEFIYKPSDTETLGRITWLYNVIQRGDSIWIHGITTSTYHPFSPFTYVYAQLDKNLNLKRTLSQSVDTIYDAYTDGNFIFNHRNHLITIGWANMAEKRFFIEMDTLGYNINIHTKSTILPSTIRYTYNRIIQLANRSYIASGIKVDGTFMNPDPRNLIVTLYGLDSNGQEKWIKSYPELGFFCEPKSLQILKNNNILHTYTAFNLDSCKDKSNKTNLHFLEVDENGKMLRNRVFKHNRMNGSNTMYEMDQGDFILGGVSIDTSWCAGYDTATNTFYSEGFSTSGYLARIDSALNVVWEIKNKLYGRILNIVKLKDGHFVGVGYFGDSSGTGGDHGWLIKFSKDGAVIWDKSYQLIIPSTNNYNKLETICELSNGDLVAVGQIENAAADRDTNKFIQRGWIVKINAEGNLMGSNIEVVERSNIPKLYPNPFKECIHIDWSETSLKVNTIEVYDLLGKSVYTQNAIPSQKKITIHPKWPKGLYYISFKDAFNRNLYMQKIISSE
jgi:hypothetical protein